ncbi:(Fe-S)-binding protein [Desulfovibrio sp. OttesenSCG-928-O18]|nr:(Fe-S)-binding protein [Desulfovibrio sp. OttesenSCG-928-O18]
MKRGCTQCGECLNVCPVFRQHHKEEFSPKGKRMLMEPVAQGGGAFSWQDVFELARLCAGCGRCKQACARKLSTADLLAEVRAAHPHWTQHLWELWIRRMGPLWPTVGFLATLAPHGLTPKMLESSLQTAKALVGEKHIAPWATVSPDSARAAAPEQVVLFSGCTAKNVRPQWSQKATDLLRAFGHTVCDASGFTCCGGTMHHAGQFAAMNAMREANVKAWRALGKPRVAVFCASCHHSLAAYAEGFLAGDEADEWKKSLVPLTALLGGAVAEPTGDAPQKYGYHQPCHWEKDSDMPFLASILPGLAKGTGLCCGMGGILKMTDPDLSAAMAATCLQGFPKSVDSILTGCSGCALQLAASAQGGVTVRHWLDVVRVG